MAEDHGNTSLYFEHPRLKRSLVINTGLNEINWGYQLNTANYPTYGGEVIQILSVFIDDLSIEGDVRGYGEMEDIYKFFAEYMVVASQGGGFNQQPMKMTYSQRNWTFFIQPLTIPGFIYSRDTVAPNWKMTAHVYDDSRPNNYQSLQEIVASKLQETFKGEEFSLEGIISMAAADPANNPFSAPGAFKNEKFTGATQSQIENQLKGNAMLYNTMLKSYLSGNYSEILQDASKPAFGRTLAEEGESNAGGEKKVAEAQAGAQKEFEFHG